MAEETAFYTAKQSAHCVPTIHSARCPNRYSRLTRECNVTWHLLRPHSRGLKLRTRAENVLYTSLENVVEFISPRSPRTLLLPSFTRPYNPIYSQSASLFACTFSLRSLSPWQHIMHRRSERRGVIRILYSRKKTLVLIPPKDFFLHSSTILFLRAT